MNLMEPSGWRIQMVRYFEKKTSFGPAPSRSSAVPIVAPRSWEPAAMVRTGRHSHFAVATARPGVQCHPREGDVGGGELILRGLRHLEERIKKWDLYSAGAIVNENAKRAQPMWGIPSHNLRPFLTGRAVSIR
jgi:hypothetical protein